MVETEAEKDEERGEAKGDMNRDTPWVATVEISRVGGGDMPPPMENADLLGFHPERVHLLL